MPRPSTMTTTKPNSATGCSQSVRAEGLGDKEACGPVYTNSMIGILLRSVEIRRTPDQPVDIGGAVRRFSLKWFGELPSRFRSNSLTSVFLQNRTSEPSLVRRNTACPGKSGRE